MTPPPSGPSLKRRLHQAKITKNVTTHTFRQHLCDPYAEERGRHPPYPGDAGHASLESTQIYTRVTINDLKEIHARFHPGEKL
ncbi:MAG: hypothetical protein JKP90_10480 [Desulfofustis sp. PB-SRB1]|nr:hypothetical protein [Desulfofustis sp. PB-SRB1]